MERTLYDILHEVSKSSMVDEGDLQAAGLLILTAALHGLMISRAGIWVITEDRQHIQCRMLIDGDECSIGGELILNRADFPHYFSCLDSGHAIVANDARADSSTAEFRDNYLIPFGITSMLDAPIRHRGAMLGIICCEHQGNMRDWTNEEIAFASALADTYGRAISAAQRNDYERQLQEANELLEQKVEERTQVLQTALRNLTRTQSQLIESEKLASLGRLVSGLAHEINTPLGIAVTSASHGENELKRMAKLYKDADLSESDFVQILEGLQHSFDLVNNNLQRAATLIHNFKLSGTIHTANEDEDFELRSCIELTLKSLTPLLKNHQVDCELSPGADIPIHSNPGAIAQIITNLVTNSIHHAFPNSARKTIWISAEDTGEKIHIQYRDSGCGIAADIRDKIFEPFFTTARKTGGSGLGLAIVYNLVTQKLKGEIWVDDDQTEGANFQLYFPQQSL